MEMYFTTLYYSFYWIFTGFKRIITFFSLFRKQILQNYSSQPPTCAATDLKQQQKEVVEQEFFTFVNHYDKILTASPSGGWYRSLKYFPFTSYVTCGVTYYDSLYDFNQKARQKEKSRIRNMETKAEAKQRLLFDRATMKAYLKEEDIIFSPEAKSAEESTVNAEDVRPGQTPERAAGKKPKDFFPLFKSFVGAVMMGYPPEPKEVHRLLNTNLLFLEVCGFVPNHKLDKYSFRHAPSLRKLEQFDQIMSEYGIWEDIKIQEISENLKNGYIKLEDTIVGDTTHYYAYSSFETVEYEAENGKMEKKSQSKPTKKCSCKNKEQCSHEWVLVDEGAGTIVKSTKKMYWGHKASVLGFPKQGIVLDLVPIVDAATHDGKTFLPHIKRLFSLYPSIKDKVKTALYDSAADDALLKKAFKEELAIKLRTSHNPRAKKEITKELPRGMQKITPYGDVICLAGKELEYQGMRYEHEKFIYTAPLLEDGKIACLTCPHKEQCCPDAEKGRVVTIDFNLLSFIDPKDPPMAKRFKVMMKLRPAVERMIKTVKCDLTDERLSKQGNLSFKAYLDKTLIAYHQMLRNG